MLLNVLMTALSGGSVDFGTIIVMVLASLSIIFLILPVHECAHGLVAYALGDDTAKRQGRLTLNPFAHINYLGALLILLIGFGWANPVPVNPRRCNKIKSDKACMAIIAAAGPVANLLAAFVGAFISSFFLFCYINWWYASLDAIIAYYIYYFFVYFIQMNVYLAIFNLIPVPPLDGSKILMAFLPNRICEKIYMNEQKIYMGLLLVLIIGFRILSQPLSWLSSTITSWIINIAAMPFGFV